MTAIVYDFADIKRRARFRDTPPQNNNAAPYVAPSEPDYHVYWTASAPLDTAPSEYCPPDFDPA